MLARFRGAARQLAIVALCACPHELYERLVVLERPVIFARVGLALALATTMQCLARQASLDLHDAWDTSAV